MTKPAILTLWLLVSLACGRSAPPVQLKIDEPQEHEISGGDIDVYHIRLAADQFIRVVTDQRGIDVVVSLFDPVGRPLIEVDSPTYDFGPEVLEALVEAPGDHRFEVRAGGSAGAAGSYRVGIEALRPAVGDDRARAAAAGIFAEGEALRRGGESEAASDKLTQALERWRSLGDAAGQAHVLYRLAGINRRQGDGHQASEHYRSALVLFRQAGDQRWQAKTLTFLGRTLFFRYQLREALEAYQEALPLARQAGDRRLETNLYHNLGHTHQQLGEVSPAIDAYSRARELWLAIDDPSRNLGHTLHNLGVLYRSLGELRVALDYFEQAEELKSELGQTANLAVTLEQMGQLYSEQGDLELAAESHLRALARWRQTEDRQREAITLSSLAQVHAKAGHREAALATYQQVVETLHQLGDRREEAKALRHLGSTYTQLNEPDKAVEALRRAVTLHRQVGDVFKESQTLTSLARAERRRGDLAVALAAIEAALAGFDSVRGKAVRPDLRASFFATVAPAYELHVDLLMDLHQLRPAAGHDAEALAASERGRARSLVEVLAGAGLKGKPDPEILEHKRRLAERINRRERERQELRASAASDERIEAVEKQLRQEREQLLWVREGIRARSPPVPRPLATAEIRRQLLDDDTLLLEYMLGEERSFLWSLTSESLAGVELPPRREVESMAREAYRRLLKSSRRESLTETRAALCELSRTLLAPVAGRLTRRRLLIVADGALLYIPFAALPKPQTASFYSPPSGGSPRRPARALEDCASAPPLVVDHEVTNLPSATMLAVLRRETAGRKPAAGQLAVVADPVFTTDDRRVGIPPVTASLPPAAGWKSIQLRRSAAGVGLRFERLPFSRREAESIIAALPAGESFGALDFAASKETVRGGLLAGYRIVHFATHGILNNEHPELSGIVLSLVGEDGSERDGFLRAHEIYDLDLPAELVVLSACRTALGKEIRGEGLVGLTQSFLHAGAARVLVSLWSVGDHSTAELMSRFYRHLFAERLRPAAALRQAQVGMWRDSNWRAPYHWAGFVLQGEPR